MKVVINDCYGGFSLSMAAIKRMAELNGRECYFFKMDFTAKKYEPVEPTDDKRSALFVSAFDIPDPDRLSADAKEWAAMTTEERVAQNDLYAKHWLDQRPNDRSDPILLRVVEELGEKADGPCAKLKIIEIPDGVQWQLDEYDGLESVHETHRSWS